jgi:hypothetical protein
MAPVSTTITLNQALQPAPSAPAPVIDIRAQEEQFRLLMDAPGALAAPGAPGAPVPLNAVPTAAQPDGGVQPATIRNIGDTILDGLERVGDDYRQRLAQLNLTLDSRDGPALGTATLITLQSQVISLSIQQDLVTRIADRVNQGIQTLFKNQ